MIDGLTVALWVILGLTLVMHTVASLVLAAFPVSSVFLSSLSDEDEQIKNGNGHNNRDSTEEHLLEGYLLPIGAMLLRIISVVTLLVFVVCVVFIAALTDTGWTGLLLALLVVFVVKILVSLFNTLLVRKYLIRCGRWRVLLWPVLTILPRPTRSNGWRTTCRSCLVPSGHTTWKLPI